jgi:hypothetical protein
MTTHPLVVSVVAGLLGCAGRYPDGRTTPAVEPDEEVATDRPWIPPPPLAVPRPAEALELPASDLPPLDRLDPFPVGAELDAAAHAAIDRVALTLKAGQVLALELEVGAGAARQVVRIARNAAGDLIAYRLDAQGAPIDATVLTGR